MKRKNQRKKHKDDFFPKKIDELEQIMQSKFENNQDLTFTIYEQDKGQRAAVFFIQYMVDIDQVKEYLLDPFLSSQDAWSTPSLKNDIPIADQATENTLEGILKGLLVGKVYIYVEGEDEALSYFLLNKKHRQLSKAENESVVLGPQIAFTESLITNMNVVRWSIRSTDLVMEKMMIGHKYPREVCLVYVKSVANQTDVNTIRQRLEDLDVDDVEDSTILMQLFSDSSSSMFPQFYATELSDRFTHDVKQGRIGVLTENSPSGVIGPSTFFSFFESTEDMYMRWNIGSFLRLLRFIAIIFSIFITPLYIAAVTYHFEIIPTHELITIGKSRAVVPFPPLFEAMILEFLIELLREAGARLPTKIGETIGIVGGVIIGQAIVEAGLTSSILIIIVALSALSSYTVPNYMMGASIRIIRFPMMILAGLFGLIGIMYGACFLVIHLVKLQSLGRPYLAPVYPFRMKDLNKALFRLPLQFQNRRFLSFRPKEPYRYNRQEARRKHDVDK
ncbi:spore germination protein [Lentibacillus kapialis]|uniref:Spore germination protein n=1 Tax=Lentibacillus kapialis TaxID=340214 RepID=A0A917Q2J0_9BACI|nr:spore germination protein [Lentibacillus kapialis]GGK08365.1 spore germination protein [Lentibacillus kapialis]